MTDPWWPLWLVIAVCFGMVAALWVLFGLAVLGPPWLVWRLVRAVRARR